MTQVTVDVPPGMVPDDVRSLLRHLAASALVRRRVAAVMAAQDVPVGPNTAWQLAAVDELRRHVVDAYGVYTGADLARLRGGKATSRSIASKWAKRDGLLALPRGNAKVYPRFQFADADTHPAWPAVSAALRGAGWGEEDVLLWMAAPNARLDGREPAAVLAEDADAVVDVARETAAGTW